MRPVVQLAVVRTVHHLSEFAFVADFAEHLHDTALGLVQSAVARDPQGSDGRFGPLVIVPAGGPPLDRLLGLTGHDPAWLAPAALI